MEHNLNSPKSKNSKEALNGKGDLSDKAADFLNKNEDHLEGKVTKTIENQTSKIPSGVYLAFAIGSMAMSGALALTSKRKDLANFVGLWAPSFLLLGLYNKIVKNLGPDSQSEK